MLEPSAKAPTFTLSDQSGTNVTLSSYGKTYMGIVRSAFLIDEKGKIERAWYKVSPKDTPTNLLTALGIG